MIEEPALLTLHQNRRRPTARQIERLAVCPTSYIADAMDGSGALPAQIGALCPAHRFCGPALTCNPGPADVLATLGALTELTAGEVLVIATGAWRGCAAIGDLVVGMAKNAGACAIVTDGLVRDIEGIREVGLPVHGSGLSPNSPYANGPGTIGAACVIGDVTICCGDLLVGDENGVVVVPLDKVDGVLERLETVSALEQDLEQKVRQGLVAPAEIYELMQSDKVHRTG